MKKTEVNQLLECIEKISESAHNSAKITINNLDPLNEQLKLIANYLGSTERQAFWFSILFSINLHRVEIDFDDLSSFLKCSIISIFKYVDDFEALVELKVVRKSVSDRRRRQCPDRLDSLKFYIPTQIIKSISSGDNKLPIRQTPNMTVYELLDTYSNLLQDRSNELFTQEEFKEEILVIIADSQHLDFIKIINGFKLHSSDLLLLLFVCSEYTDFEDGDLIAFLKIYFSSSSAQMKVRKEFMKGTNRLQVLKLVDIPSDNFRTDRTITLSEYAKELLFGEDKELFLTSDQKKSDIILSSEIIPQKLFFNKNEQEQLDNLIDLLKPDNFNVVCSRMKDMGMRTGFNILLYGPAGTGKTESCLQLAKQSCRDIYKVSIEQTKSKWFGESEKLVKGIFDHYAKLYNSYNLVPILLLNECDGILGKRQVGVQSSVSQTENAIQNLLLESMELFNGILIATTNLTCNLDAAFERRFIYKIELKKPDSVTRELIWRDKIPGLTDREYLTLSERFDFSGGQTENIARKNILFEILNGSKMNLSHIIRLCEEEFLDKSGERKRIGFLS